MTITNGILTNQVYTNGSTQSVFPVGSYYMVVPTWDSQFQTGAQHTSLNFVLPGTTTARLVNSVSFLVLGVQRDILTGGKYSTSENRYPQNAATEGQLPPANVTCSNPYDCPNYTTGFTAVAKDLNGNAITDAIVYAVNQGEAGYRTGVQDFPNFRVTLTSNTGFSSVLITDLVPAYLLNNTTGFGAIMIDQITFDAAVPEPGTFGGAAIAVTGLLAWHRRRTRRTRS